jgi:hypothetical protein
MGTRWFDHELALRFVIICSRLYTALLPFLRNRKQSVLVRLADVTIQHPKNPRVRY